MRPASPTTHPCGLCAFCDGSVWQPVAGSALPTLTAGFSRREIAADQALFQQGDDSLGVFCVSRGLFAIRSHQEDGTSILLKLAYPGDIIGFRSFLANEPHKTEARALIPSRICTVARRQADRLVQGDTGVLSRLTGRCVDEIDISRERIIGTATADNKKRLAGILTKLMRVHGRSDGQSQRMRLPLSRTDLADLLGITPETVSRVFKRLKDEGHLEVSGRDIRISTAAMTDAADFATS